MRGFPCRVAQRLSAVLIFLTAPIFADSAGDSALGDPNDLSKIFIQIHQQVQSGQTADRSVEPTQVVVTDAPQSAIYLLVPGLFGNHIEGYFGDTLRRLKELGLDSRLVSIDTEGNREKNLQEIGRLVAESPLPAVLLGHSRGGNHIHDWYRGAPDNLKAKVVKMVFLQAPLQGLPFADWVLDHGILRFQARLAGFLPGLRNVRGAMDELSTRRRKEVLARLPPFTNSDLRKIYTISTTFDDNSSGSSGTPSVHTDMEFPRGVTEKRTGEKNDGLVPLNSSLITGAKSIIVDDLDHEDTILQNPGWLKRLRGSRPNPNYKVADFSETIVRVLYYSPAERPEVE